MPENSKLVFLRLLTRRAQLIRRDKIKYLTDMETTKSLEDLLDRKLISSSIEKINRSLLNSMSLSELQMLAKRYDAMERRVAKTKKSIIESIIRLINKRSSFLDPSRLEDKIKKWLMENRMQTFSIGNDIRIQFSTILICANPSLIKGFLCSQQLKDHLCSQLLQRRFNSISNTSFCRHTLENYPFKCPDDLACCVRSVEFAFCVAKLQMDKQDVEVVRIITEDLSYWKNVISQLNTGSKVKYTGAYIASKSLIHGIESFERMKKYGEACDILRFLIETNLVRKRLGRLWHRLCLNEHVHLKQDLNKVEEMIKTALEHEGVVLGDRLLLRYRLDRLHKCEVKDMLSEKVHTVLIEAPVSTKTGTANPNQRTSQELRNVFINHDNLKDSLIKLGAIEYYIKNGYTGGIHAEGQILCLLFGLYFIDIIYADLSPSMFFDHLQLIPMDFGTMDFVTNRQDLIDRRLSLFGISSNHDWLCVFKENIQKYRETKCGFIDWDLLDDDKSLQIDEILDCFQGPQLKQVFQHILFHEMHCFSGVPDLLLWDKCEKRVKFVEVKGPGDKLSANQIAWMEVLMDAGVECEVLRVNTKTKSIRTKKSNDGFSI
ncbi:hypothetical protein ACOME3_002243 [Neoechinorhynchus agilis]